MEMSIIWGMCLVLGTTELNSNQVMSLDIIMQMKCAIGYRILELWDIHLTFVMKIAHRIHLVLTTLIILKQDNH